MAQAVPVARQATGLVREVSSSSVLIYNINFVSIGLMLVFARTMIPWHDLPDEPEFQCPHTEHG